MARTAVKWLKYQYMKIKVKHRTSTKVSVSVVNPEATVVSKAREVELNTTVKKFFNSDVAVPVP